MKPLSQLRIDFMGRRNLAFIVSAVMLIVSIGAILFQQLNLGLDFTGGTWWKCATAWHLHWMPFANCWKTAVSKMSRYKPLALQQKY